MGSEAPRIEIYKTVQKTYKSSTIGLPNVTEEVTEQFSVQVYRGDKSSALVSPSGNYVWTRDELLRLHTTTSRALSLPCP